MAEGKKPILETHKEASNVLAAHLREAKGKSRKRSPLPPPSEKEIRNEVHRILEEFLKKQLLNNNEDVTGIPTSYQKVVVEDIVETDGPVSTSTSREGSRYSSKTSCARCRSEASQSIQAGSIRSLTDDTIDFPFIDGVDEAESSDKGYGERSKSLPSNIIHASSVSKKDKQSLALSKSLSPSHLRQIRGTGSPLSQVAERGDTLEDHGYLLEEDVLWREGNQKDIEEPGISRARQRLKSGTESSEDTDNEEIVITPGRKKKSIFTRLKERMNRSLSRGRNRDEEEDKRARSQSEGSVKKRRKPRKKANGTSVDRKGTVVQNVHTHKHGHIEQHHYTNGNKSGVLMEKEVWESTDVMGESEHKHKEKHANVKESKELQSDSDSGILRKLKKMTSFRRAKKDKPISTSMKKSKSDEVDYNHRTHKSSKGDYNRSVSTSQGYQERVHENGDHSKHSTTTTVITGRQSEDRADEYEPRGPIQGEVLDRANRNKSFVLDFETCERQERRVLPDGSVDTTVKQHVKVKHFDEGHDVEVDGNDDEALCPRHASSEPSDPEKDRLYSAVAERLAHIGDQYMATSPLSESAGSSMDRSHGRRGSGRTGMDERDGDGLTALERQLIDTFREVGDNHALLNISPDSIKDAALEIAKHATYQQFQEVVNTKIGTGNSWDQIAAVFYLTKKAVTLAGAGGAVAVQVKDLAAEYVANKFASWIVDQGGWDTCLDSDTDLEID